MPRQDIPPTPSRLVCLLLFAVALMKDCVSRRMRSSRGVFLLRGGRGGVLSMLSCLFALDVDEWK